MLLKSQSPADCAHVIACVRSAPVAASRIGSNDSPSTALAARSAVAVPCEPSRPRITRSECEPARGTVPAATTRCKDS